VTLTGPDLAGLAGVACIAAAYLLLQTRRLDTDRPSFSALNAVGAALVLFSLAFDFNLAAALIEGFWLVVSLYGLGRSLRRGPTSGGPAA